LLSSPRPAADFPTATVISVSGPDVGDMGSGYQWFSVRGITKENRPQRIASAMPRFVETIRSLQKVTGTTPAQTVLIGFSQGAIIALVSTQTEQDLAGRVVAFAGRFARLPERAPVSVKLHVIHGNGDTVVPYHHSVTAAERLVQLGAKVTVDIIPHLAHGIDQQAVDRLVVRLRDKP
jgi:phospholipase/carboxylesterase